MKNALNASVLIFSLAAGSAALEIAGTVPADVKGAPKGDFILSGLVVKNVAYEKGAVIMPVTENKGRTYADVKLLSKGLYGKIEACFKNGCAQPAAAKSPAKAGDKPEAKGKALAEEVKQAAKAAAVTIKVEEFKPLKSKVRVANAEVSFDGELTASLGVMVSAKEPGAIWIAFPDPLEFKDGSLKAKVEETVKAAWAKNKK
ncbi:MAG TPA: hypothetical protein PKI19_04020 [Elusimicrobiales bacterium]|nr:hypothetical protein [Elusimicrobiales bacterium]